MFTLELIFLNEEGSKVKVSVDDPRAGLTQVEMEGAMDTIIAANVFTSKGGNFVSKDSARIVERNVTEFDIA
ncbi:MAG: DUF2922 domain-containing protein [Bacillota bacterium]|jgi:hypothetical protein|uniref:DUF2922 domain-containing protein n=1 Tax=Bacillus sp. RO2 TaxID=2723913 RepID=UPI00145EB24E|nr:DUF2922 domain-containing protein [Bacillus sp. RO2]MEA3320615.1 DUF2922 domain-containing protein [Bacillota bacterium]NMH74422.1 DUF2922 domain-containing protein [Bacillus sp. RO2]